MHTSMHCNCICVLYRKFLHDCVAAGMMWLWDLSSCLGWQKGGPTGLWMQDNQVTITLAVQLPGICIQCLSSMRLATLSCQYSAAPCCQVVALNPTFFQMCIRVESCRPGWSAALIQLPNLAVADMLKQFCIASCVRVIVLHQVRQLAAQQTHSDPLQPNYALPYQAGFQQRWPDMLGSLTFWDGLPKVCLHNGGTCPIIAISSNSSAEIPSASADLEQCNEYIACLSLLPTPC